MKQTSRGVVVVIAGLLAGTAHADQVRLVGGSSIEGKASRRGDKVVIEVESGEIALSVDDVERIDAGSSVVQRFDAMRAKVGDRDVRGLVTLANFCRDNDMRDREQQLLVKVLELTPDHAEARARLGYVRSDAGWVKREEQLRQQGYVQYDGRWIPRAQPIGAESHARELPASPRPRVAGKRSPADKPEAAREGDMTVQAQHGQGSSELASARDKRVDAR